MANLTHRGGEVVTLGPDTLAELTQHPLRMLPHAVRPAVTALWACHRHLVGMESPMPIAALLATWIAQHGLTTVDAEACCRAMLAPAAVAQHRYASDLTAALAQSVNRILEQRRREQAQVEARRQAAQERQAQDQVATIRQTIRQLAANLSVKENQ